MPAFSRFLRYFVAVGRAGSIRRAAETLNISSSAVDRQLLAAEEEFGLPLFERLPAGLRLTAAGEIVMQAGLRWQKELASVRVQIDELRGLRAGHVEIALIDALARGIVPRLIEAILADYPGISFTLRVLDNLAVQAAIIGNDVEFGILIDPQSSRDLTVRASAPIELGLVARPDHPLAVRASCRLADSVGHRMILPAEPLALCERVRMLQAATNVPFAAVCASDNVEMIKSLVRRGIGIGLLTSLDVAEEVLDGSLIFIPLDEPVLRPLSLALCHRPSRQISSASMLLMRGLESLFDRGLAA
jgi:DNA-binding transcriptional LysR family regulator